MGLDCGGYVASEVFVDDCVRVGGQKSDAFFDGSAWWPGSVQHSDWLRIPFDHNLIPRTDAREQTREIATRIAFGDADSGHIQDDTPRSYASPRRRMRAIRIATHVMPVPSSSSDEGSFAKPEAGGSTSSSPPVT